MKIKNLIQFPLTKAQYYPEVHQKKQIVLHHTVSGGNAKMSLAAGVIPCSGSHGFCYRW